MNFRSNVFRSNVFRSKTAVTISEDDLLAYHLGDLSPGRERAVRRAIEGSAALAAESKAIGAALDAVKDVPVRVDRTVLDRNWEALRPALRKHTGPAPSGMRWRGPLAAGGLLAGAAGVALLMGRMHQAPVGNGRLGEGRHVSSSGPALDGSSKGEETYRVPSEPSAKANLSGGVYRPDAHKGGSVIHLLGSARAPEIAEASPLRAPTPLSREPVAVPGPLTPAPVGPAASIDGQGQGAAVETQSSSAGGVAGAAKGGPGTRRGHTTDVMLGLGGNLIVPQHSLTAGTEPRTQTASPALLAIGAFHQQFRRALGYRVTASYSRPEFDYTYSAGTVAGFFESGRINSRIFELAGTYVVEGPHRGRLRTSADAGGALMAFLPAASDPNANLTYRAAGVLGVNLDVAITKHLGARLAYRAQVFRSPDFRYTGGTVPVTASLTESNEPALGVTYRFGK